MSLAAIVSVGKQSPCSLSFVYIRRGMEIEFDLHLTSEIAYCLVHIGKESFARSLAIKRCALNGVII